jgi:hypothetical protein
MKLTECQKRNGFALPELKRINPSLPEEVKPSVATLQTELVYTQATPKEVNPTCERSAQLNKLLVGCESPESV